jgi:hypothetical protein
MLPFILIGGFSSQDTSVRFPGWISGAETLIAVKVPVKVDGPHLFSSLISLILRIFSAPVDGCF